MRIERIAVSRLNPAAYNPRIDLRPGDPDYEKLKHSLDEFGLVEPLVWNKRTGHIVGGHQRFKLLVARGDTHAEVSVVDLTPEKEKALNIALNKISGGWDGQKLAELLDELVRTPGFDIELTGFDPPEVDALLAEMLGPGRDGDAAPERFDVEAAMAEAEAQKGPAVTRPGELLTLGGHRLLCGDCTDPRMVRALVESGGRGRGVLFATDPPYLVNYDGTNHFSSSKARTARAVEKAVRNRTGEVPARVRGGGVMGRDGGRERGVKDWSSTYGVTWDDADANSDLYERFIRVAVAEAVTPGAPWYCWHASKRQAMLEAEWNKAGAFVHQQIIWVKNRTVLTRSFYTWQHEPCLMGWVRGHQPKRMANEPMRSTVWSADIPSAGGAAVNSAIPDRAGGAALKVAAGAALSDPGGRPDHPTPKPLVLFETPMRQHTRVGDVVYEPFCGSGTQLIAAERLKRRCLAVEISPRYCDVIVRRWLACVAAENREAAPRALVKRYLSGVKPAALPPAPAPAPGSSPAPGRPPAPRMSPFPVKPCAAVPSSEAEAKPLRRRVRSASKAVATRAVSAPARRGVEGTLKKGAPRS